jgi:hypothetical protein
MTTRYKVQFQPSFHPETEIEVLLGDEGEFVRVHSADLSEQVPLSVEQGVSFLEAMDALAPGSIPDGWEGGIDGCTFSCSVQDERGRVHRFSAWCPRPERSPQQHAFISLIHRLAWDAAREPGTVARVEQLFGYFNDSLPARVFEGEPLRIRIFGRLSSTHSKQLDALFASVPPAVPVLVDMTNFEGMGTLLLPRFRHFHERDGQTAWLVNATASHYLREAGIPAESLFRDIESAMAALQPG